ncbi:MAG: glycosyltransferase [Desulfobacteraceae bacterium]|nr:MAG: glycosyltransferase [Desulfobacteraceae bacterium]
MDTIINVPAIWALVTAAVLIGVILRGVRGAIGSPSEQVEGMFTGSASLCEVLVPVSGRSSNQELALTTLLTQDHPNYRVLFIVESEDDPADSMVERLCETYGSGRKVLSGPALSCGQKNHNLIAGINQLKPDTEIIVFCDSGNIADPGWLRRLTRPLEAKPEVVVTTFRDFNPTPATIGGVCQAIYGSLLLVLPRIRPSPWGGATAMNRETLEELDVIEAWSKTVVDDVVLGRLLYERGIPMILDRANRLDSPLRDQTVQGFLSYLRRQILFPKFIEPALWLGPMIFHLNLTLATLWALFSALALPCGAVSAWTGSSGWAFLLCQIAAAMILRKTNRHRISLARWMTALYPCIFFGAVVFLGSIFSREIAWAGRRYFLGRKGRVIGVQSASSLKRGGESDNTVQPHIVKRHHEK